MSPGLDFLFYVGEAWPNGKRDFTPAPEIY